MIPFAFAGCKKDDKTIRINEVTHSVFYAPLYLADALGYFEEEGFKIDITNGGGADKTMAAVLANEADVGFCGPEAVVYTYLGGSDDCPKVFGQLTKRDGSFLVGRVKEDNFDWKTLEGKDVIGGRPGGVRGRYRGLLHDVRARGFGIPESGQRFHSRFCGTAGGRNTLYLFYGEEQLYQ